MWTVVLIYDGGTDSTHSGFETETEAQVWVDDQKTRSFWNDHTQVKIIPTEGLDEELGYDTES